MTICESVNIVVAASKVTLLYVCIVLRHFVVKF